jgi:hypothetical protein
VEEQPSLAPQPKAVITLEKPPQDPNDFWKLPPSSLLEIPVVAFDPRPFVPTAAENEEIRRLIESLVEIDKPDFGLSPLMSGQQFAPIPETRSFENGIIGIHHGLDTPESVRRLVELGPKAIPALLVAIDDKTPSKVVMRHDGGFGGMWHEREVPINPANPRERAACPGNPEVLDPVHGFARSALGGFDNCISSYAVTRGDIAFVVLGQIVNRQYQAVRYQPSACTVINSPSKDADIARALRAIWASDEPARTLFDSLLADFRTTGGASTYQAGAALRLAFYFPDESRELLVDRVRHLDVGHAPEFDVDDPGRWDVVRRASGGVWPAEILTVLRYSRDPAIIGALAGVLVRAEDVWVVSACLTDSVAQTMPEAAIAKVEAVLLTTPDERFGPYGRAYELLRRAAEVFGQRSQAIFEKYVRREGLMSRRSVVHALRDQPRAGGWPVEVLTPLLDDRANTGEGFGPEHSRTGIRVCDEAAETIVGYIPGATFEMHGSRADLDRQIEAIRAAIATLTSPR